MTDDLDAQADRVLADAQVELARLERRGRGPDRRERLQKTIGGRTACPKCRGALSRVMDPRPILGDMEGTTYWRVRSCLKCGALYTTEEIAREILDLSQSA